MLIFVFRAGNYPVKHFSEAAKKETVPYGKNGIFAVIKKIPQN